MEQDAQGRTHADARTPKHTKNGIFGASFLFFPCSGSLLRSPVRTTRSHTHGHPDPSRRSACKAHHARPVSHPCPEPGSPKNPSCNVAAALRPFASPSTRSQPPPPLRHWVPAPPAPSAALQKPRPSVPLLAIPSRPILPARKQHFQLLLLSSSPAGLEAGTGDIAAGFGVAGRLLPYSKSHQDPLPAL